MSFFPRRGGFSLMKLRDIKNEPDGPQYRIKVEALLEEIIESIEELQRGLKEHEVRPHGR